MRLEVLDRLGVGDTYRGLLWPAKRPVAVRTLSNWSTLSIAHLRESAESLARLRHPNVVDLVGIQDSPADPYLIFEWVDGVDLRHLLTHGPMPVSAALHIARGVLSALGHAHSHGVVHGRLSPSKVLISREGHVKVTGLGFRNSARSPLAAGDALLAALPYVSPEDLRGDMTDHRSDLFNAGVLLYQLLTGRSPFGSSANGMLRALLSGAYRPLSLPNRHLSASLEKLVVRLLSPRETRYQNAADVLAELWRMAPDPDGRNGRGELVRHLDGYLASRSTPSRSASGKQPSQGHAGSPVSRYQLQKRLGRGGMGDVWRGTRRLGHGPLQTVAFKFVRDRDMHGVATIEQIEREARTAMILRHTNIAAVYDVAEVDGRPCIVMEHVDGIDLRRLCRRGSLAFNLVRCVLRDVLAGLQHAHERGVLHRDLSPANIMIDRQGVAHLMDFGVARNLNDTDSLGLLVGTAPFMAPETLEAEQWSRASDGYSLGAVFYSVLAGRPPYGRGDRLQVLHAMRAGRLLPLPDSVPADLCAFVMAALHLSPARRQSEYVAAVAALAPLSRTDRALLGAEVRRAMGEQCLEVTGVPARRATRSQGAADTGTDDVCTDAQVLPGEISPRRVSLLQEPWARDDERRTTAHPAQAGRDHDTSTARTTIRLVSGILPNQEVVTGMSEVRTTRFLDALSAWYEAGEPASGDEVTPVQFDLQNVREAYHQLEQVLQTETAVQWSHFLQACQIRPPNREWIWLAIEELAAALGYDASYFEEAPEPELPEPKLSEERPPTERDVLWARLLFCGMHETVYGYRPDGVAKITDDMDEVQRFLAQLESVIANFPALRKADSVQPQGGALPNLEQGISRLFRYHDALPEADKEAIEREWQELASAMYSYTEARQYLRSLYERMADKLVHAGAEVSEDATTVPLRRVDGQTRFGSDSGRITASHEPRVQVRQSNSSRSDVELVALPTLPTGQNEQSHRVDGQTRLVAAGPVIMPDERPSGYNRRRLFAASGAAVAAIAAVTMVVMLPSSESLTPAKRSTNTKSTILSVPIAERDYPICETNASMLKNRPAPAVGTPKRRKAAMVEFVKDTDSVRVKRENKPDLLVTVTEVAKESELPNDAIQPSTALKRVHALDAKEFSGKGIDFGINDPNARLTLELGE